MRLITRHILFVLILACSFESIATAAASTKVDATAVEGPIRLDKLGAEVSKANIDSATEVLEEEIKEEIVSEENEKLNWWRLLLKNLLELVFTVLGVMGTALVTVLFKKYGFQVYTDKVNDILNRAVGFANQRSIKFLKLQGTALDGSKKLELAIEFAKREAKKHKLKEMSSEWWEDMLESQLGIDKK